MNVKETVRRSLLSYPLIHKNALDVYEHLFCTIGGGYNWENGELVDPCDKTKDITLKDSIQRLFDREIGKSPDVTDSYVAVTKIFKKGVPGCYESGDNIDEYTEIVDESIKFYKDHILTKLEYEVLSNLNIDKREKDFKPYDKAKEMYKQFSKRKFTEKIRSLLFRDTKWKIYPMSIEYAHLCNFPDDIKLDWLIAIDRMCYFIDNNREYIREGNEDEAQRCLDKAYDRMIEVVRYNLDNWVGSSNKDFLEFLNKFEKKRKNSYYHTRLEKEMENAKEDIDKMLEDLVK